MFKNGKEAPLYSTERELVEQICNHSSYQGLRLVCGHGHSCANCGVATRGQRALCLSPVAFVSFRSPAPGASLCKAEDRDKTFKVYFTQNHSISPHF